MLTAFLAGLAGAAVLDRFDAQTFMVLPIAAVWLEINLGFPRDDGIAAMQLAGRVADRIGGIGVTLVALAGLAVVTVLLIAADGTPLLSVYLLIPAYVAFNATRRADARLFPMNHCCLLLFG